MGIDKGPYGRTEQKIAAAIDQARAKSPSTDAALPNRATVHQASADGMTPPPNPRAQASLERAFGDDLAKVKVHRDDSSASAAKSVQATAFTRGNDISFAPQINPEMSHKQLLAHELTHVVQQRGGQRGDPPPPAPTPKETAAAIGKSSAAPHQDRVVVSSPPLPATPNQTLGAAHATVKNLAKLE
jgi:Domain of unknown function (DUF4157)